MARRAAPALYELMRRPGSPSAGGGDASVSASPRRTGNAPGLPSTFEVSLAKAAVIGAAVVVAIAVAYGIGVQRGSSLARSSGSSGAAAAAPETPKASDSSSPRVPAIAKSDDSAARTVGAKDRPATDNNGDPRVKGMRYFVLAHPSSERASELVDFCQLNGLDAYLVPDDTALLRKVIVLPGYRDPSEKSSPEIKALEAKIRNVGDKWKAKNPRANKDFREAYPEAYR